MSLIKQIKNGKTEIEIYSSDLSDQEKKTNLSNLYKVINKIASNQQEKGRNVDDWFFTAEELKNAEKSGNYNFL